MAMARSLLRAEAHNNLAPKEVLQRVNKHLRDLNEGDMFVTILYGLINRRARSFEYARAGHEIPVLCDEQGRLLTLARGKGQVLGVIDSPSLDRQKIRLAPTSTLLLYSDGVIDAADMENERFGIKRVQQELSTLGQEPAQSVCDHLFQRVSEHQAGVPAFDDITMVVIRAL
jgi:serine phosphatase RsbU (regulator of sigma subunit)